MKLTYADYKKWAHECGRYHSTEIWTAWGDGYLNRAMYTDGKFRRVSQDALLVLHYEHWLDGGEHISNSLKDFFQALADADYAFAVETLGEDYFA